MLMTCLAGMQDLVCAGELTLLVLQFVQFAVLQAQIVQFVQLVGQQLLASGLFFALLAGLA